MFGAVGRMAYQASYVSLVLKRHSVLPRTKSKRPLLTLNDEYPCLQIDAQAKF